MEYRRLGNTGLQVSAVGLGGNGFGQMLGRNVDEASSIACINHAIELGITFIDTADMYGKSKSEEYIGKALKGKRHEVVIATKFGSRSKFDPIEKSMFYVGKIKKGEDSRHTNGSRDYIMEAVDASLKRLQTDYIDLYQMHSPDPLTPIEETLRALDDLIRAGKVRYIGCSNYASWQLCEAIWTSRLHNLNSFVTIQSKYNLFARRIETELAPCCQAYNIGVIPYTPLASGFLTGKYKFGVTPPTDYRLSLFSSEDGIKAGPGDVFMESSYNIVMQLESFAKERGHTVAELAIAWLLSHPWISTVIAGAKNVEQVSANAKAGDWKLTEDEVTQIEAIVSSI